MYGVTIDHWTCETSGDIRERFGVSRTEEDRLHSIQDRPALCYTSAIEVSKHTSACEMDNFGVYLLMRCHPINAKVGGIMFGIGSIVEIDDSIQIPAPAKPAIPAETPRSIYVVQVMLPDATWFPVATVADQQEGIGFVARLRSAGAYAAYRVHHADSGVSITVA